MGNKPRTAGSPTKMSCPAVQADWQLKPCSCAVAVPGEKWSPSLCWRTPCLHSYLLLTISGSQDHMETLISGLLKLPKCISKRASCVPETRLPCESHGKKFGNEPQRPWIYCSPLAWESRHARSEDDHLLSETPQDGALPCLSAGRDRRGGSMAFQEYQPDRTTEVRTNTFSNS